MCAMLLADLGATVHPHRSQAARGAAASSDRCATTCCCAIARDRARPEGSADGVEAALQLIERADALIEGFRPGVTERHGARPGRVSRAQSAPRLRPHDRLGTGRPARPDRRARHQLHRDHRRAERDRARRPAARRCRSISIGDYAGGSLYLAFGLLAAILERAPVRDGPGRRRRDRRRRGLARDDFLRHACRRHVAARNAAAT